MAKKAAAEGLPQMAALRNIPTYYDMVFRGVEGDLGFYRREAAKAKKVLYVACGAGRVMLPILQDRIDITGIVPSQPLLSSLKDKAKALGLKPRAYCMEMSGFSLRAKFDLVIIPYHSFLQMKGKDEQMRTLKSAYRHLLPGGRLIVNFFNPDAGLLTIGGKHHISLYRDNDTGKSYEINETNSVDHEQQTVRTVYVVTERKDWAKPTRKMYVTMRYVFRKEFEDMLRGAGFRRFELYGGFHFQPFGERSPDMVWIIHKDEAKKGEK